MASLNAESTIVETEPTGPECKANDAVTYALQVWKAGLKDIKVLTSDMEALKKEASERGEDVTTAEKAVNLMKTDAGGADTKYTTANKALVAAEANLKTVTDQYHTAKKMYDGLKKTYDDLGTTIKTYKDTDQAGAVIGKLAD
jgi:chromosome segregation ATPase